MKMRFLAAAAITIFIPACNRVESSVDAGTVTADTEKKDTIPQDRVSSLPVFQGPCTTRLTGILNLADADFVAESQQTNPMEAAGEEVKGVGDINGDGYGDFVVGAPVHIIDYTAQGVYQPYVSGAAYLFFGGLSSATGEINNADAIFYGSNLNPLGSEKTVAGGDIDRDGFGDLLLAFHCSPSAPDSTLAQLYNGSTLTDLIRKGEGDYSAAARLSFVNQSITNFAPITVNMADVSGDGNLDIILANQAATVKNNEGAGIVFTFNDPNSLAEEVNPNDSANWVFKGNDWNEEFGASVVAADVDADGLPDIIIDGAIRPNFEATTFVFSGEQLLPEINRFVADDANVKFSGRSGYGVISSGDLNADGVPDIVFTASFFNASKIGEGTEVGAAMVIFGKPSFPQMTDLDDRADVYITGSTDDNLYSVAVGDIDGDGSDDLVLGAYTYPNAGGARAGAIFVFYGPLASGDKLSLEDADAILQGENEGALTGYSISLGDVNGDSNPDLLIGAPLAGVGGKAYVKYSCGEK